MSRLRYQLTKVRRNGLVSTIRDLLRSLAPATLRVHRVAEKDFVGPPADSPFEVQTGVAALRKAREGFDNLPDAFYTDLRRGVKKCYFTVIDGQMAAIVWAFRGHKESRYFDLGPHDANLGTLFVLGEFRRRGLARLLMQYACRDLFRKGYRHIYTEIDDKNIASIRTQEPIGLRKIDAFRRPPVLGPRYSCEQGRPETWWEALRREIGLRRR